MSHEIISGGESVVIHCDDDCPCDEGWEFDHENEVLTFDSRRRTNADLIVDLVTLGYLHDGLSVLDLTYGKGRFWSKYRPPKLVTNDLDVDCATDHHLDFRDPPPDHLRDVFAVVVCDPPYGLRGTVNDTNGDYGLGEYLPVGERHWMMDVGLTFSMFYAKPGGLIVYKCQEQTCNGRKYPQPYMVYDWAMREGLEYESTFHVHSHRPQPAGRGQKLIHQNYSSALLFRRPS